MRWARIGAAFRRSVIPLLAGIVLLLALDRRRGAYAILAFALVVFFVGILSPRSAQAFDRFVARTADVAARCVSFALSWVAWALTVLPTWAWSRLFGSEPLRSPWVDSNSNWLLSSAAQRRAPNGRVLRATRSSVMESPARKGKFGDAPSKAVAVMLVIAMATLVVAILSPGLLDLDRFAGGSGGQAAGTSKAPIRAVKLDAAAFDGLAVDTYTHEHEPWAPALFGELSQLPYRPDPFLGLFLGDFVGDYVNVKDGHRVSYSPKKPTITVWFFGGSTMFGVGQRDDHTIPSVVARLARQDGIRIKAMNFGYSGFVNWQETQLFDQLLTSSAEPPDLAVFYDGVNDRGLGTFRVDLGIDDPDVIARLPSNDAERSQMKEAHGAGKPMAWGPEREALEIKLASTQYRRGADLARLSGKSYGVPVVHFWQPQPFAKEPNPADDELWKRLDFNPQWIANSRAAYDKTREVSGVNPVDLTHIFDAVKKPIFFDSSHTNELGASIVATKIYENLRPTIKALDG
ncbi:MAG: hypothetical protein WBF71_10750 [Microthrixaceae bacterium]